MISHGESNEEKAQRIPGWGVDADLANRPGVPRRNPEAVKSPRTSPVEWQAGAKSEIHPPDSPLTPVYGTTLPLGRVRASAWVKRIAYRIPQDKAEHWMLLLVGDRLDVLEHRVKPLALLAAGAAAIVFATAAIRAPAIRR